MHYPKEKSCMITCVFLYRYICFLLNIIIHEGKIKCFMLIYEGGSKNPEINLEKSGYFFIHLYAIIKQSRALTHPSEMIQNMMTICEFGCVLQVYYYLPYLFTCKGILKWSYCWKKCYLHSISLGMLGTFFDIELYFSKFIAHCICEHSNKCFWNYINHMLFPCFLTLMRKWEYFMKLSEFLMSEFSMISFETF